MDYQVNMAIQILPLGIPKEKAYAIIDAAIQYIQASGIHHEVCPFETVLEGPYAKVMEVYNAVQGICMEAGAEEILVNSKLQRAFKRDISILEKTAKYQ